MRRILPPNVFIFSIFICLGLGLSTSLCGQMVEVDSIQFKGNERSKRSILKRELDFKEGDLLDLNEIDKKLEFSRRKLMNTNLFIWVRSEYHLTKSGKLAINFDVLEQWYFLGYPVFQLADRNLNEWWARGHPLDRAIYGIHLLHNNFRGRAERLMLKAETGFTQRLEFSYNNPYVDRKKTLGIGFNLDYLTSKNIAYKTQADTLVYLGSENILREKWSGGISFRKRFRFYDFQTFEVKYSHNLVSDTITKLNPAYFQGKSNEQNFMQLGYTFSYDFRDYVVYPLVGKKIDISFQKYGVLAQDEINFWEINAGLSYYFDLGKKFYFSSQFKGKITQDGATVPYANQRGLGYRNEVVRGFELKVVDGTDYFLSRNTLKYQLFKQIIPLSFIPYKQFNQMPLSIYPTAFLDLAYVNQANRVETKSNFANKWLFGYGVGLDIVTYYNFVLKMALPFNNGGKYGFVVGLGREF
ncbi:BamA/TamA family outer membrane protein [Aquirufa nivalisilvae]|uniref:BamA/TamA family outer membrane protein n=1 Tax=Aquirufa nivalisilvae TaxID=2516557 RepID=UPI001032A50D|nr:BamA/TamA family outer membrane protein [Aquirufa nivalisilvae]TBH73390.1 outer membrane protein assembly factor [Aquirufa nivalisilvae]